MKKLTQENLGSVIGTGKQLIKFHANWCGTCKVLAPKMDAIINENTFEGIDFYDANVEDEGVGDYAKLNGVRNLPCMLIVENGKVLKRLVGDKPKEEILDFIS